MSQEESTIVLPPKKEIRFVLRRPRRPFYSGGLRRFVVSKQGGGNPPENWKDIQFFFDELFQVTFGRRFRKVIVQHVSEYPAAFGSPDRKEGNEVSYFDGFTILLRWYKGEGDYSYEACISRSKEGGYPVCTEYGSDLRTIVADAFKILYCWRKP